MCGCDADDNHRPVKEITPSRERRCTDLVFLLLWFGFWGFSCWLIAVGQKNGGDPQRIIRGVDMAGQVCGIDAAVKDKPLAAWPYPTLYGPKVCVADCKETETDTAHFAVRRASTKFIYYCVPISISNSTINFGNDFESDSVNRSVGDLFTAWPMILASAFLALFIALIYTWFLKTCAGCLVWGCIIITILGGSFLSYVLLKRGLEADGSVSADRAKTLKWAGSISTIITFIFMCIVLFLRKRINLAVTVVKESGSVLGDICSLVLFPCIPIFITIGYLAFWLWVALYLYSVGTNQTVATPKEVLYDVDGKKLDNPTTMLVHKWDSSLKNLVFAHVFGLAWTFQFIVYLSYMVIAGTVADWYFSVADSEGNKKRGDGKGELSRHPICSSFKRTCRFHLGTLAFGSLIIAIIQTLRAILLYIQKKTSKKANQFTRCLFACVACCLKCMQSCLDKISKNAFVWTAIWGDNFGTASCRSFALLWRNLGRVAAINMVGVYIITMGKITVTIVTTGLLALAFVSIDYYVTELNSPILPCLFIAFISWVVSSLFMVVFETTMDTMFLCFLVDYEHNGIEHLMAPKSMKDLVEAHAEESSQLAQQRKELRMSVMTSTGSAPTDYSSLPDKEPSST